MFLFDNAWVVNWSEFDGYAPLSQQRDDFVRIYFLEKFYIFYYLFSRIDEELKKIDDAVRRDPLVGKNPQTLAHLKRLRDFRTVRIA